MSQSFSLYTELTVRQNLDLHARLFHLPRDVARQRIDQLVSQFGLGPYLDQQALALPLGIRQRLSLAVAIVHEPELLILDEPTSGLDPLVQQSFFSLVQEARGEGRTVFLSSHILSEVERSCDRVAIIRDGRIVRRGRVEELRDLAHHQVELRFAGHVPRQEFEGLPGVSDIVADDHVLRLRVAGPITPVVRAAAGHELLDFVSREPTLEETFLAEYGRGPAAAGAVADGRDAAGLGGGQGEAGR
jgi:ABC-type multidrug transport system ATPase subunit